MELSVSRRMLLVLLSSAAVAPMASPAAAGQPEIVVTGLDQYGNRITETYPAAMFDSATAWRGLMDNSPTLPGFRPATT